jgi:hypothetical protein
MVVERREDGSQINALVLVPIAERFIRLPGEKAVSLLKRCSAVGLAELFPGMKPSAMGYFARCDSDIEIEEKPKIWRRDIRSALKWLSVRSYA